MAAAPSRGRRRDRLGGSSGRCSSDGNERRRDQSSSRRDLVVGSRVVGGSVVGTSVVMAAKVVAADAYRYGPAPTVSVSCRSHEKEAGTIM
jgi:ribosome assembly protein YihI (activator of Der GTPase)